MGRFAGRVSKQADAVLGGVAVQFMFRPQKVAVDRPGSFLVIRPGGIGDAVLLVPALLALREGFPHAVITVLAERRNSAAFSLCGAVDKVLLYDKPLDFRGLFAAAMTW